MRLAKFDGAEWNEEAKGWRRARSGTVLVCVGDDASFVVSEFEPGICQIKFATYLDVIVAASASEVAERLAP